MSSRTTKILVLVQCKKKNDLTEKSHLSENNGDANYPDCAIPGSSKNISQDESPEQPLHNDSGSEVDLDSNHRFSS